MRRLVAPTRCPQALAVDYARSHLRSELAWTKAKMVVLAHMASNLRTKLAQAQAERAQAGAVASNCWVESRACHCDAHWIGMLELVRQEGRPSSSVTP